MPPPLMLEILTWWIEEGMIDEIINWHRREIMARLKIAKAVLGSGRLCCDPGTYHVWMRLPPGWHSSDFVERSYRSEEHTSELQSLMRISYAVFCLKQKTSHHVFCQT